MRRYGRRTRGWLYLVGLGLAAQLTTCQLAPDPTGATSALADSVQSFVADFLRAALAAYVL